MQRNIGSLGGKEERNYYRTCASCGAHLDPGERCDCVTPSKSQPIGNLEKRTAAGAVAADSMTPGLELAGILRSYGCPGVCTTNTPRTKKAKIL